MHENLDECKRAALKSWGLTHDETVVDCDPSAETVTYENGDVRQRASVYTRVMGYHRRVTDFNIGKAQEHRDRAYFVESPE